jgi:phosphoglycerate dehydrogenase-like enzyme
MSLRVLEYVRDPAGIWTLPAGLIDGVRRGFPGISLVSPADCDAADAALPDAEVVFGYAVRPENFERAKRLRWIHTSAAGVGGALFPALAASDVILTNGRGLWADAMAEHAFGMMLSIARKLGPARDAQRERRWADIALRDGAPPFRLLAGSTLGLVGFGSIGRAVAARARGFGMDIVAVRRRPGAGEEDGVRVGGPETIDDLFARSDWIVVSAPLTEETHGAIDGRLLARMKPDAVLVNLGRGALVNEDALVRALERGAIGGAALDVTATEPLPAGSPLWSLPNVLITPHVSGLAPRLWERAVELFARNLGAYLEGRPLENVVDKRAGY